MSARTDALVSQQETGKITAFINPHYVRLPSRRELSTQRVNRDWFLFFRYQLQILHAELSDGYSLAAAKSSAFRCVNALEARELGDAEGDGGQDGLRLPRAHARTSLVRLVRFSPKARLDEAQHPRALRFVQFRWQQRLARKRRQMRPAPVPANSI
jgi:hypothetical protein